ncbi:hypothetical protein PR202_ga18337 [Eleusine coracana subsp. coracana]|uniref:DUF3615 domain-containing protein n=1 Tax=Eleusine coracana subsp. coracana TaxID=191504 RepID=A0AAV5CST1_ELECO|nr:hypothetical protein PR202_ga18337 [Eleusine coracana subsp. coracana]
MMGSTEPCETDWGLMPALPLEELVKDLCVEDKVRVQINLRERERILKRIDKNLPQPPQMYIESQRQRDNCITAVARHAIRRYNAKHPDDEFDAVRSLNESTVHFRGELWYHINFWAHSRRSNKIKRFFAEVHYKQLARSSVHSSPPVPVPEAEVHDRPSASSSVCSDPTISVPEAQVCHRRPASISVCSHPPGGVPEVGVHDIPPFSSFIWPMPPQIPIVEVCTIIEEPLGRYRRSCAFCAGSLDILHPKGSRKFVCGNDKDRMVQQFHFSRYTYNTRR